MLADPPPVTLTALSAAEVAERLRALRVSVAGLAEHESVAELLTLVARAASQACGLERVCLWRLDDDELVPVSVHDQQHPHLTRDFVHLVGLVRPKLAAAPIEAAVVRTHEPELVADALRDGRVFRPLVGIVGTKGYVVAAVPDGSGTFGVLTADHGGGAAAAVDELDLELLSSFGAALGRMLVIRRGNDPQAHEKPEPESAVSQLQRLREGLSLLQTAGRPEEIATRAVVALCDAVGFDRAALFTTEDGVVRALAAHARHDAGWAARFAEQVRFARLRFDGLLTEFDMLGDPRPMLVAGSPEPNDGVDLLLEEAGIAAYAAAPVMRGDRVVGMLHAARLPGGAALDQSDLDLLGAFADAFGYAMDRALLHKHIPEAVVGPASFGLTSRERDVMALLAAGASNPEIAATLVISATTAKSHVQHILRKLGAANRAEAVARFLQAGGTPSAPQRQSIADAGRGRANGADRDAVDPRAPDRHVEPAGR
jgi:LuxR family transcriptional regulator, regulator of acetate metabolism